jgi:hypothetical protein
MQPSEGKKEFKSLASRDAHKPKKLDQAKDIADLFLKILSSCAIVVAGIWGYFVYYQGGARDWVDNISIQTEVLPYHDDLRLLVVHVKSKNPRLARLEFSKSEGTFDVAVRKIPLNLKEKDKIDDETGEQIAKIDLVPPDGYELLPNSEFDDIATVVVHHGDMLYVTADMEIENGTLTKDNKPDHDFVSASTIVHIVDSNGK